MAETSTLTEAAHAVSVASASLCADLLPWLQAVLMPLIVLATAFAAWRVQRAILARRAAFDYILNHELPQDWTDLSTTALQRLGARPNKDDWAAIATCWSQGKASDEDVEHTKPIFRWLNRREFIAIALLNGSMHQPTYARYWGFDFIREWERAEPFVSALRSTHSGDDDLYCNFEELAAAKTFRQLSHWTPDDSIHDKP